MVSNKLDPVLSRSENKRVGQALHSWSMLEDGDRVLVAVSGGRDSLVLAWLLQSWLAKAPIHYSLLNVHVDMGAEQGRQATASQVRRQLEHLRLDGTVLESCRSKEAEKSCFHCARQRRKQLFDYAARNNCNKIAFGHHKDDLLETLFINMLYSGNISTMVPRQDIFDGEVALIRPLALLEKKEVVSIAQRLAIVPVANNCPLAEHTKREDVRMILESIYQQNPGARQSLFASMANVRTEYLL